MKKTNMKRGKLKRTIMNMQSLNMFNYGQENLKRGNSEKERKLLTRIIPERKKLKNVYYEQANSEKGQF